MSLVAYMYMYLVLASCLAFVVGSSLFPYCYISLPSLPSLSISCPSVIDVASRGVYFLDEQGNKECR